ncbi:MarR family transcriptional regulator [Ruminococcaceae bacterium OttesenSCG-928-A16]|nr:MarR family transcriptional regulator [Ruminococcaceae bacterium OttesenSCG-928-A16]
MDPYSSLKLENQLCFPLYAAAKEVVRLYTPYLDEIGLTYTQYIAMMLVWEKKEIVVKDLAQRLFLDTGTLTPLLKKLEAKGVVSLTRAPKDKRSVVVALTPQGQALRNKAAAIPAQVGQCLPLKPQEAQQLYTTLYKLLGKLTQ